MVTTKAEFQAAVDAMPGPNDAVVGVEYDLSERDTPLSTVLDNVLVTWEENGWIHSAGYWKEWEEEPLVCARHGDEDCARCSGNMPEDPDDAELLESLQRRIEELENELATLRASIARGGNVS